MLNSKALGQIRDYSFKAHCHEVKIFQKQGIELTGYGVIKINAQGTFYLDFVCLKKSEISDYSWSVTYPIDELDQSKKLYLVAKTTHGMIFESDSFSLNLHALQLGTISEHYIFLSKIKINEPYSGEEMEFYIESNQHFPIPKNIINKSTSTLGGESATRNEACIELTNNNLNIRIINLDEGYSYIVIKGDIDRDKILECLTLYLGFSSGILLQPYCSVDISNNMKVITLYSVVKSYLSHRFIPAIPSTYSDSSYLQWKYHFNVLGSCINLYSVNKAHFSSLYAQWKRIWLSSDAVQDITSLTLATGIEGVLNDVFIPVFKKSKVDDDLICDIENIKKIIKSLEIKDEYKQRLDSSVSYLKEITATKALNILLENNVIKDEEVKAWKKFRNQVAHPKIKNFDLKMQYLEQKNFTYCVNLFNSLVLQSLSYSGPRNYYLNKRKEPDIILFNSQVIS